MKKELKIGIFVISVIVISFFVLNYLRGEDIFNREYEVQSRYENVEGLVASAPVYIKGYKAGKVTDVTYNSESGDFLVVCSLLKTFKVPVDSRMVIYGVDIMGGKGVRIDLGHSEEYIGDGGTLMPFFEPGLMESLGGSIGPLMDKVGQTLDSLNVAVSGVNNLLSEANRAAIEHMVRDLEATMSNIRSLSSVINGRSSELNALLVNLSEFSGKLGGIAEKIDTTMSGVGTIVDTVNDADIAGVVTSFKSLLEKINDPDGTIGRLLVDDSMYDSVDSLLGDVNVLVNKIQENPKKYLKISVF